MSDTQLQRVKFPRHRETAVKWRMDHGSRRESNKGGVELAEQHDFVLCVAGGGGG